MYSPVLPRQPQKLLSTAVPSLNLHTQRHASQESRARIADKVLLVQVWEQRLQAAVHIQVMACPSARPGHSVEFSSQRVYDPPLHLLLPAGMRLDHLLSAADNISTSCMPLAALLPGLAQAHARPAG